MTVTLTLPSDVARLLEAKASRSGKTLETYLASLAEQDVQSSSPLTAMPTDISLDEFDRLLDELSDGPPLPRPPEDFSRADIYADHN
ncbi:MAG TPA: hypothetical protein VFI31_29195 [Pirellulales bacterium]|nr:hypothetical protein [Pirellulales bacterium]